MTQNGVHRSTACAAESAFYLPDFVVGKSKKTRGESIFLGLPDALDLMVVCVEAGLGLDAAMRRVTSELAQSCPVLCEEFAIANFQLQMGRARKDVLRDLGIRTGVDDVRALAAVIIQAEKFGSSIGSALRVQSDAMRLRRRQLAEERAAKTAVKIMIPLILFIFPGVFVVLVGPAAMRMSTHVRGQVSATQPDRSRTAVRSLRARSSGDFSHGEVAMFKSSILLADDIEPSAQGRCRLRADRSLDRGRHLARLRSRLEACVLCYAQWCEVMGTSAEVRTPIIDSIGKRSAGCPRLARGEHLRPALQRSRSATPRSRCRLRRSCIVVAMAMLETVDRRASADSAVASAVSGVDSRSALDDAESRYCEPKWRNGRRAGLKIRSGNSVWVQVPPSVLAARGESHRR